MESSSQTKQSFKVPGAPDSSARLALQEGGLGVAPTGVKKRYRYYDFVVFELHGRLTVPGQERRLPSGTTFH